MGEVVLLVVALDVRVVVVVHSVVVIVVVDDVVVGWSLVRLTPTRWRWRLGSLLRLLLRVGGDGGLVLVLPLLRVGGDGGPD